MDRGRFSSHFRRSVDKMWFPSSVCESFHKKWWRAQFYLKMAKALTLSLGWFILSISMPTLDRGRFSSHFLTSADKMCISFFSLWEFSQKMLTCSILSQNGEGPDPIFLVIYPFNFNAHNGPGSISRHFLLSADKMCFPSSVCESFLRNADMHKFISKWRRPWPFLWGDLSFRFQRPQWTGLDFSATSFYLPIKCVFPASVCESFLKKYWLAQFYLHMAKALTQFFFILSISMPTRDRVRFFSHFLLSADNICFSFFSLVEFSQKMVTWTILSQNGEGPDPIFLVIYPFNFNAHNVPGSIFQPLSSIRG